MTFHALRTAGLALAAAALLSCTGGRADAPSRGAAEPILGVTSSPTDPTPECAAPVVTRDREVPLLELTIAGQAGDSFGYQITKDDGTVVAATSDDFAPNQRTVIFSTGVPHSEIRKVTIHAEGEVGVPGTCVITSIR